MSNHIATLAQSLGAVDRAIRLLPAGRFRSNDGRPARLPWWNIDRAIADKVILDAASRDDMVIDFDHQTLQKEKNGQPAPAAGWIKKLVWREGQGLFAVDVKWTERARAMIAAGEYRFISPVFSFDDATGDVQMLLGAGLTNTPGLTGLTDLAAMSSQRRVGSHVESQHHIDAFNQVFSAIGVFHPGTSPQRVAELTGKAPKPQMPGDLTPEQKENMRILFPDAFAPD